MRLSEALQINQQPVSPDSAERKIHLICGFTPLHLETFVRAYAKRRFPGHEVDIVNGLFGDLEGNLRRAAGIPAEGAIVAVEWSDLDERLGLRASAGWSSRVLADIPQQLALKISRLERAVSELAARMPVAISMPTLPLPPLTCLPPAQTGTLELQLRCNLIGLMTRLSGNSGLKIVSESALACSSAYSGRRDVKAELYAGFPYTVSHASALAELAVECLFPAVPKKGLITDLDDTLWRGILGDAGLNGISWCLDSHSHVHALYQQMLASLAESGVLIGIASKNDPALVKEALARPDILLRPDQVFPVVCDWGAKSESVGRILSAWNISADSVVFVDDSPMELAEVATRYPAIECLRFPSGDPSGMTELLNQLRSRFGKTEIREEDRLRLQSLRATAAFEQEQSSDAPADFLAQLDAKIVLEVATAPNDGRAFELVNKTNQFNLNGRRYTEGEWKAYFEAPGAFLLTASYEDRFGPLGKIAVLTGRKEAASVEIDVWVMSCRAFSRHIEYQLLRFLYGKFDVSRVAFAFRPTERNGPLREFLRRFFPEPVSESRVELPAGVFMNACPQLFHQVTELNNG